MLHLGVVVPWIDGLLTAFLPALCTTQFSAGVCVTSIYASLGTAQLSRGLLFLWRYVLPVIVCVLCYWKIIGWIVVECSILAHILNFCCFCSMIINTSIVIILTLSHNYN